MKKFIYCTIVFILSVTASKAQFTLEQVYDTCGSSSFYYDRLQINGEKYVKVLFPEAANQSTPFAYEMKLYNLDHSLWKTIDLSAIPRPTGTNGPSAHYYFLYVTDSLFNSDSLVEFLYCISRSDTPAVAGPYVTVWNTYVFNENQTLLFADTAAGPFYTRPSIPQVQVPIVNTSFGTKMMLATLAGQMKVYGLSGRLPTQYESVTATDRFDSQIFPNPSSGRVTIKYDLPAGTDNASLIIYDLSGHQVREFVIDRSFDNLSLSTAELMPGTYYYLIKTNNQIIGGKKFVNMRE